MDTVTRLLQACDQGDLDTVKDIAETSDGFDVNVAAIFCDEDGDEVMGATPLYLAARRCYLEVCQYLVGEGAAVNTRSIVKSQEDGLSSFFEYSPLHVAIFYLGRDQNCNERKPTIEFLVANGADLSASPAEDGILYPIWTFCSLKEPALMMLLIDLNLILPSFPWCPELGRTVLHHWASSGQDAVQIFEKLLAKGFDVNVLDKFGLTPLKVAAIGYPDDLDSLGNPNEYLLRFLLHERDDISLSDKIEALELAGAALLLFKEGEVSISRGFQYWYEAQDLRDSAEVPITKALLNSDNTVHWRSNEWTGRVQLEELQHRPLAEKKMQAFLVTRRLLAHISPSFLVDYLWFRYARDHCYRFYLDERYIEVIDICWLMLEGGQDPGIDEYWSMVVSASYWLVMSLCMLKDVQSPFLTLETWNLSLKLVLNSMNNRSPRLPSVTEYVENGALETISPIETVLQMITALSGSPEMMTPMAITQLEQFVQREAIDSDGYNLLLTVCLFNCNGVSTLDNVRLLLDLGADPNTRTPEGMSPLQFVAIFMGNGEMTSPLADLLLEYGAHLDQTGFHQRTPLDIWKTKHAEAGAVVSPPAWMNPVHPLRCCSSRVIQRHKISLKRLPKSLRDYASKH